MERIYEVHEYPDGEVEATIPHEEIVRCRYCKTHFTDEEEPGMVCRRKVKNEWGIEVEIEFKVDPNGFCAWGERES